MSDTKNPIDALRAVLGPGSTHLDMRLSRAGIVALLAHVHARDERIREQDAQINAYESRLCQVGSELVALQADISAAIGTTQYMDPPDGGDVSLAEQVRRMRADADRYRCLRDAPYSVMLFGDSCRDTLDDNIDAAKKEQA